MSAFLPMAVLSFPKQPSWQTARALGESAKQLSTNSVRKNASRAGGRFIEFLNG